MGDRAESPKPLKKDVGGGMCPRVLRGRVKARERLETPLLQRNAKLTNE